MRFLRHLRKLLAEFMGFAWENKTWWLIPLVLVLLMFALLIAATQTAVPAFIYTLF